MGTFRVQPVEVDVVGAAEWHQGVVGLLTEQTPVGQIVKHDVDGRPPGRTPADGSTGGRRVGSASWLRVVNFDAEIPRGAPRAGGHPRNDIIPSHAPGVPR
jgi:hypothetical protein